MEKHPLRARGHGHQKGDFPRAKQGAIEDDARGKHQHQHQPEEKVPEDGAYGSGVRVGMGDRRLEECEAVGEDPEHPAPKQDGQRQDQRHPESGMNKRLPQQGGEDAITKPPKRPRFVLGR